jgi:chromosome segregation ATPase
LTDVERIAELARGDTNGRRKQTIADLERQVATLQHQLRLENNRRRHLEVRAAQLQAAWWSARKEVWGARSELYESEAINDQLRMAGDQRVADADLLDGFVVDELPR